MGTRHTKAIIDLSEGLSIALLDNGDILVDSAEHEPMSDGRLLVAIEQKIDSMENYLQRLTLVRELVKINILETMKKPHVKPLYNSHVTDFELTIYNDGGHAIETGPCADCDNPATLYVSQWGHTKHGDLVCHRCEHVREQEYGIPLVDPD